MPRYFFELQFADYEQLFLEHGTVCHFEKRELFPCSDYNSFVYYILSGIVKFSVLHESGFEKLICFHGKGALFPYSMCLPTEDQYRLVTDFMQISAVTDLTVIRISPEKVFHLLQSNFELHYALTDYCICHSNLFLFEIMNLSKNTALIKTCNFLYVYTHSLREKGINLTQAELGEAIGESRLEVARALKRLRENGIIDTARGSIRILELKRLLALCSYDEFEP